MNSNVLTEIPGFPPFDPTHPVENAVITRLAGNWHRRATVKRKEPELEDLFEVGRPDYPEHLVPFTGHPVWEALDPEVRSRILSWAWLGYNKHTVLAEQRVVNPAFAYVIEGEFPSLGGPALETSLAQAMVDEQYHTLMHLNASTITRQKRKITVPDTVLPAPHLVQRLAELRDGCSESWEKKLTTLAFATVSETSISAYLHLLSNDPDIQVINSTTVQLHNRDEICHASITGELAKTVYDFLSRDQQRFFVDTLITGLEAFVANDYGTWHRILTMHGVPRVDEMIAEVQHDAQRKNLVRDFSGLRSLLSDMDLLGDVDWNWEDGNQDGN
ncbi:AurF N-oxygenase family protein [Streptomyces xanthophaeus]|uniref:AurF N-oxygenase family protein n=1 Tax=Streptomyces xanthophaeus TaxID=67385 RepID=UPI002649706B|nr:diiron oxygenase [Streptomyces xanthophaeus]WKD33856.1 diiron oxygenase [Streptomyces xanthophaeus]